MKPQTFEEKIELKVQKAKDAVRSKLFRDFCACSTQECRDEIGAKMNVMDALVFEINKEIRSIVDK